MKAFTFSALSTLFAGLTLAHPVDLQARQSGFSDVDITILQFALTLEHLENEFYRSAFRTFTLQHFLDAGFDEDFFLNLQFIAADEAAHVELLAGAIQGAGHFPVQPCQYNFPVTDIQSFVTLSAILESVGTSAYLGAAPFVGSKDILGIAASIMAVEAFHTSLQRTSIGGVGAPDPFATPLGANAVFTLAAQFIVSCPSNNPPLPFTAFPGLAISDSQSCFRENSFDGKSVQQMVHDNSGTPPPSSQEVAPPPPAEMAAQTTAAPTETSMDSAMITETSAESETAVATETAVAAESETVTDSATVTDAATSAAETAETSTETSEGAEPTAAPERRDLSARQSSRQRGCSAPFGGSSINLVPDFGASRHDFSRVVQVFVTFVSGFNVISVAVQFNRGGINVNIPTGIGGQVFVFITVIDISGGRLSDSDILFGPAIMEVAPAFPSLSF
ncbi:uncharacterized protein A1O9_00760 [Exophiala aquamarina CBS 119918]|uniref:Uncharacterized protein n=1 Tax=Exophiala aquamarina CBS 119918 TaxID=1182545 RepID=A0A072PSU3_9EURO|nr:uncharacterized protein A1O9_00760 [Exophiala aquamarina CBS 119918]KEF62787.1 hypothetical protein A1O9_00760 [Exophiala aquamarina CBS 119918]